MKAITALLNSGVILAAALCPMLYAAQMNALNGHLSLTLPDEAVYGERSTELMGPGPGDDETLIWIGEERKRVAILITELGRYAPKDFTQSQTKSMKDALEDQNFEYGALPNIVYGMAKESPAAPNGGNMLGTADLRHTDGTMQRISFYFAQDRAKDIEACRKLIIDTLKSVKAGDKPLPLHARVEHLAQVDKQGNCIKFPLPKGCFAIHAEGADFLLNDYRIITSDAPSTGQIRIYVGHHPGRKEEKGDKNRPGKLFGKEVTWHISKADPDNDDEVLYATCLASVTGGALYAHLMIWADNEKELERHIRWAEELNVGKPTKDADLTPKK